jgi:hypothetical protein
MDREQARAEYRKILAGALSQQQGQHAVTLSFR